MKRLEERGKRLCTIAMHLASPTRIKPSRSSGSSGRKAHARPSWWTFCQHVCSFSDFSENKKQHCLRDVLPSGTAQ